MKCPICKNGETQLGFSTVTLEQNESVIVFKKVPSEICENCNEYYLDAKTSDSLLVQAETAVSNGAVFEICNLKVA